MYIVTTLYDSPGRLASAAILLTEDLEKAIEAARNAEKLGFEFRQDFTYVVVSEFEVEKSYRAEDFTFDKITSPNFPAIYIRLWCNERWHEAFYKNDRFDVQVMKLGQMPITLSPEIPREIKQNISFFESDRKQKC